MVVSEISKEKTKAPAKPFTILAIDDEELMLDTYFALLKNKYRYLSALSAEQGLATLQNESVDLILLDLKMPGMEGREALRQIKQIDRTADVIVITADLDLKGAIHCMKDGAYDFVPKPFEAAELLGTIYNCLERRSLKRENTYLRNVVEENFEEMQGKSPTMQRVFEIIETISENDSTALILGESGTGKELVARAIHKKSPRKNQPFVVVNCAAIPDNLFESELFGYEKGAFTGAIERHPGKFETANGGTIFLDEIGCLPLSMQGKLLRVIQEGEFDRVGGRALVHVNVRIVAATNAELRKEVRNGKFREDLFYRLNVIPILLPPLRDRGDDILRLAHHFLLKLSSELNKKIQGFDPEVLDAFQNYPWPGNVRELENMVERLTTLERSNTIQATYLPPELLEWNIRQTFKGGDNQRLHEAVDAFERNLIHKILEQCHGNQTRAARLLGIHRTTLISKLSSYEKD